MKGLINDLLHGSFRLVMMIIVPNSRAHKVKKERGEVKEEYEEVCGTDYGGMVQPSQQHASPCVKGVEWGFGTSGLGMLAVFWADIPVKDTLDAGVVPRL